MRKPTQFRERKLDTSGASEIAPLVLDIESTCVTLSISRTAVYDLISRHELCRVKIGRRTLIPVSSIEALIRRSTHS